MKKLILLTILFCSISFGQILKFDEWGGNLYTSTSAEIYGLNNVPLKHLLGGKYTFSRAGADLEALFDKIDSLTLAMSSLNILDDGLTTQILVGGGLNVVPVWGTNLPTAITIGSAYIYRVGGTDVADGDVADTITITNISQVQDITATATEINYITDVTSNIQAQIDSKQDTVLGITSAEIAYLDGLTDTIQQQLDLKAPLTAPTFATSITGSYLTASEILITDGSKNIISAAVATYPSLTELTYVKGVTSAIQTQMNLKAPLASPTFTGTVTADTIAQETFYSAEVGNKLITYSTAGNDADDKSMQLDSLGGIFGGDGIAFIGEWTVSSAYAVFGHSAITGQSIAFKQSENGETFIGCADGYGINFEENGVLKLKFNGVTDNFGIGSNLTPAEKLDFQYPVSQFDSLKMHKEKSKIDSTADIILATGVAGWGFVMIGNMQEYTTFYFTSAGAVTLGANATVNVGTTKDAANKLNIYDAGNGVAIQNYLSAAQLTVALDVKYYVP